MYRIAICDDDMDFGCRIEEYLKEYAKEEHIEIETEVLISGQECLKCLEREVLFDLLFLDIELEKEVDGIQVGHILRSDMGNEMVQIVYMSGEKSHAMQLFKNRPMDFLIKPVTKADIRMIMEEYRRIFGERHFFNYHVGRKEYHISDDHIMYFQCSGKKIRIIMDRDKKEFNGNMREVIKRTVQDRFWCIHKSYIVNIDYVSEFRGDEVVMVNGEVLPVSRTYRKEVHEKLMRMNEIKRKCR